MKTHWFFASPIIDITGNTLASKYLDASSINISRLISKLPKYLPLISIFETNIENDISFIISSDNYKMIFADEQNTVQVLKILRTTKIPLAILEELLRIKKTLPRTYYHILAVNALSVKMCFDFQNKDFTPEKIAEIGFVHDLGKSRLPFEILEKFEPLTKEEFNVIKEHPFLEYLLSAYYFHDPESFIAQTSFLHHERGDGSGYPRGIRDLNTYAQIIIPCDIFDALISHRPYRSGPFTKRAALDLLLQEAKLGRVDRKFVICLISYLRKSKPHFKHLALAKENRDNPPIINNYGIRAN
ncbi:MAG: HD domain-containing protein [Candidatus Omnitrophica bacterium]|nr:HD domain-containing protein [Candidatus Omnitrophota bacterium]